MGDFENIENYDSPAEDLVEAVDGRDLAFLAAGIAIGAGLALLLTPKRGHEVRRAIGRGYRKAIEGLSDRAYDLRERAHDLRERAEDLREHAPNLLRFARRAGRRQARVWEG
jgi:gas vesicle protein